MSRLFVLTAPMVALLAACENAMCPAGTVDEGGRCVAPLDVGRDAGSAPDARGEMDAPGLVSDTGAAGVDTGSDAFAIADTGVDAFSPDAFAEPDGGSDAGPCSRCPASARFCASDGVTCVECNVPADCTGENRACIANRCVACDGPEDCPAPNRACVTNACVRCDGREDCAAPTPACVMNDCRECSGNSDCPSAAESRCETSTSLCAPCGADADCSHVAGAPRCVAGTCRQCTTATAATDCGANSCHPSTNTCTTTPRGSIGQCGSCITGSACGQCVADSECPTGHVCGAVNPAFGVTGNYCLPLVVGPGCPRPFAEVVIETTDLRTTVSACRSRVTTCEAIGHQGSGVGGCTGEFPPAPSSSNCGATGVDDGLCIDVTDHFCAYRCIDDSDCPLGVPCDRFVAPRATGPCAGRTDCFCRPG